MQLQQDRLRNISKRWLWFAALIFLWVAFVVCLFMRVSWLTCMAGVVTIIGTFVVLSMLVPQKRSTNGAVISSGSPAPSQQAYEYPQEALILPQTLAHLQQMDPREFEVLAAAVLVACEEQEFVRHTGRRGDRGVDVLLRNRSGRRVILQCKRYKASNTVGPATMRELGGTIRTHDAVYGYLITSSTFTSAAYQEKASLGFIRTIDGSQLMNLLHRSPDAIVQALTAIKEQMEQTA